MFISSNANIKLIWAKTIFPCYVPLTPPEVVLKAHEVVLKLESFSIL